MSKAKTNKDKQPLFPPHFLIAVAEKGLGFVKGKITVHGPKDIPVWRHHDNVYLSNNSPLGLEALFLSPEGRDLMETKGDELDSSMACRFFGVPDWRFMGKTGDSCWRYEFGNSIASHKNKHVACLLAFAQLVGVMIPKDMKVWCREPL